MAAQLLTPGRACALGGMDENRPASNLVALWDSKPSPAACRYRKTDVFAGFRAQHLSAYGTASLIKTIAQKTSNNTH
jgi:hypothetical protein